MKAYIQYTFVSMTAEDTSLCTILFHGRSPGRAVMWLFPSGSRCDLSNRWLWHVSFKGADIHKFFIIITCSQKTLHIVSAGFNTRLGLREPFNVVYRSTAELPIHYLHNFYAVNYNSTIIIRQKCNQNSKVCCPNNKQSEIILIIFEFSLSLRTVIK